MKKRLTTILLLVVFLVGLSVLLYPTVASYINSLAQEEIITSYSKSVSQMSEKDYSDVFESARAYNERLLQRPIGFEFLPEEYEEYRAELSVGARGVMGYLEVPCVDIRLPIYHGTNEAVLQAGVGHLEGSSLPIGGPSTHTVLTGHRGLPSATLLSNIDRLVVGDRFMITVLNEILTYEADQILVVLPENVFDLLIESGKDYATLLTCTPYGVNSHRLLVRGHRVANEQTTEAPEEMPVYVRSDAHELKITALWLAFAILIFAALLTYAIFRHKIRYSDIKTGIKDMESDVKDIKSDIK